MKFFTSMFSEKWDYAIRFAKDLLNSNSHISLDNRDHPIYLMVKALALPLQAEMVQPIFSQPKQEVSDKIRPYFYPRYSELEQYLKIPIHLIETSQMISIDFSKDCILVESAWDINRMKSALSNLATEEWQYDQTNHKTSYFEPFKVGLVKNGLHSSTVGLLKKQGVLSARIINCSILYDFIRADAYYYYRLSDNQIICEALSFEESLIFEIGRLILQAKGE